MQLTTMVTLAVGLGDAGPAATTSAIAILAAAMGVGGWAASRAWRPGSRDASDPALLGALHGALVSLGALAVVDNVVFHWLLGFHRFKDGWQGSIYVEVALVLVGAVMAAVGIRGLRALTRDPEPGR